MSDLLDKPSCWVFRTEFELEPLLEQYLQTYPSGDVKKYQIVFTDRDEDTGDFLYVVLIFYNRGHTPKVTRLEAFLDAHCKLHNKLGAINQTGFPPSFDSFHQGGRILGNLEGRRKA